MSGGGCGVAGQVCKALACLTDDHPAAQQACTAAIVPLVSLLSHPDTPVVDQACQALACLASDCPQHQAAAGQAGAVLTLMNLLCDLGANGDVDGTQQQQEVVHLLLALLVVATQVSHFARQVFGLAFGHMLLHAFPCSFVRSHHKIQCCHMLSSVAVRQDKTNQLMLLLQCKGLSVHEAMTQTCIFTQAAHLSSTAG